MAPSAAARKSCGHMYVALAIAPSDNHGRPGSACLKGLTCSWTVSCRVKFFAVKLRRQTFHLCLTDAEAAAASQSHEASEGDVTPASSSRPPKATSAAEGVLPFLSDAHLHVKYLADRKPPGKDGRAWQTTSKLFSSMCDLSGPGPDLTMAEGCPMNTKCVHTGVCPAPIYAAQGIAKKIYLSPVPAAGLCKHDLCTCPH